MVHSYWMLQVIWLLLTNHSALLQSSEGRATRFGEISPLCVKILKSFGNLWFGLISV